MKIKKFEEFIKESLPRESSVKQLQRVMKISDKTDIGNKVDLVGNNLNFNRNPIKTGIESYEDYEKQNKKFNSKRKLN